MEIFKYTVSDNFLNKRIDSFITIQIPSLSRTRAQGLIKNGFVKVNEKNINKNYKLQNNDEVEVGIPKAKDIDILPENIPLNILFEDEDVILVNKPQGMVVHPDNTYNTNTLVNALLHHCKGNLSGINGVMRPGIVHRIDKDTSGILVIAKNDASHQSLSEQLATHSMTRIYYAIVCKNLKQKEGTINAPIGRSELDRKKMSVTSKNSKKAITHYKLIKQFKNYSLVELKLETGRTHQIRVHMSYIGNPLLGDKTYGYKNQPFNLEGQLLHAKTLGFIHPKTKEYLEFETELPEYFLNTLKKL